MNTDGAACMRRNKARFEFYVDKFVWHLKSSWTKNNDCVLVCLSDLARETTALAAGFGLSSSAQNLIISVHQRNITHIYKSMAMPREFFCSLKPEVTHAAHFLLVDTRFCFPLEKNKLSNSSDTVPDEHLELFSLLSQLIARFASIFFPLPSHKSA